VLVIVVEVQGEIAISGFTTYIEGYTTNKNREHG